MTAPSIPPSPPRVAPWLRGAIIVLAVFAIYWPALRGGWLWDDQKEILHNPELANLGSLGRAWIDPQNTTYYPLTTTLFWIELRLWGANPAGYHACSILLHAGSALLVWRVLARLGLRHAWWGGLVFAVHPVAVESVAWIAELKNTASTPLLLLAFLQYLKFDDAGRRRNYAFALLLFLLAMLCKTAVAMGPLILLLHAWWKRGRIGLADVKCALPFLVTALVLGSTTLWFEHHRAIGSWEIPLVEPWQRLPLAGRALAFYLGKLFAPVGLMPVYPAWPVADLGWLDTWPWLAVGALLLWGWRTRHDAGRGLVFALAFLVLNLLPVLGFVPIAYMRYSWVADHLAYLALLGAVGLVVAAPQILAARIPAAFARFGWILGAGACLALGLAARAHAAHFAGPERFWNHVLERNPHAWVAQANLAQLRVAAGDLPGAIDLYRAALRVAPHVSSLHFNLGTALLHTSRAEEALVEFEVAARLKPQALDGTVNAAAAEIQLGRIAAARARLERALARQPETTDARLMLGETFEAENRLAEAVREYGRVVTAQPGSVVARLKLANARYTLGDLREAARLFETVLAADPVNVEALANLGAIQLETGDARAALRNFEEAARLDPRNVSILTNFATALAAQGRFREALVQVEKALHLDPHSAVARDLRTTLLQEPALRR